MESVPIFMEGEIRDRESIKSVAPKTRILGFDIFHSQFTKAILQYSRYSPLYFTTEALALSKHAGAPTWLLEYEDRIKAVSAYAPEALAQYNQVLLVSIGPEMLHYVWLRLQLGRPNWPITAVTHSLSPPSLMRYVFTNSLCRQLNAADVLVCSSRAVRRAIENTFEMVPTELRTPGSIPFQLPVIPIGINTAVFSGRDKADARERLGLAGDQIILLYFGRFSATYKAELKALLIAYSRLNSRCSTLLVLAGDDTEARVSGGLTSFAHEIGCGASVVIIPDPSVERKLDLYAAADIFVSPSDNIQESYGITIAEAMAAGLPVVASDWSGYRELVRHGSTGFLVKTQLPPLSDAVPVMGLYTGWSPEKLLAFATAVDLSEMVQYLEVLVNDGELRQSMGRAGKEDACTRLDWKHVIAMYDSVWAESLIYTQTARKDVLAIQTPSYLEIFGHYAGSQLTPETRLCIQERWETQRKTLMLAAATGIRYTQPIFDALLEGIHGKEGRALGDLVREVSTETCMLPLTVELHVGRLLKLGLVHVGSNSNSETLLP